MSLIQMARDLPAWVSLRQAAPFYGVNPDAVSKWCRGNEQHRRTHPACADEDLPTPKVAGARRQNNTWQIPRWRIWAELGLDPALELKLLIRHDNEAA